MHWSNWAGPETTLIDTLPSRSILRSSLQLQRSPSTTFAVSSRPSTAERQRCNWLSAKLEEHKIYFDQRNLGVTELCFAVGYSSLGSFSSRFTQIVGETPTAFQHRYGGEAPRIPG